MDQGEKVRENRARRMARRQGYRVMKSRARDPRALEYGGYQIVDLDVGGVVAGFGNVGRGFAFSLEDVEEWLEEEK